MGLRWASNASWYTLREGGSVEKTRRFTREVSLELEFHDSNLTKEMPLEFELEFHALLDAIFMFKSLNHVALLAISM